MSKDVKGESKELGKGDYYFESWKKKKNPHTHSEVSSTNIRKQLLQHEEIGGKIHDSAHVENLSAQGTRKASPLTQVYMDFPKLNL